MGLYLGIDTSNYTTSAAVYDSENNRMIHRRRLLPVKEGQLGLRQSDAVFHHTQQFYQVYSQLAGEIPLKNICAVGVSSKPRSVENSYMPCFTVGVNIANVIAETLGVPVYEFSHQEGHMAAAVYSCGKPELLFGDFLGFHLSGGTTEVLLVKCSGGLINSIDIAAETLDLNAGQVIDRAGVAMGLGFPCGKELEALAKSFYENITDYLSPEECKRAGLLTESQSRKAVSKKKLFSIKTALKEGNCCLSGVENKCQLMLRRGESKEKTAAYCLAYIEETLVEMTDHVLKKYGSMPLLYAGGVMSNSIIRERIEREFKCCFASPEFSSDNGAGAAYLAGIRHGKSR